MYGDVIFGDSVVYGIRSPTFADRCLRENRKHCSFQHLPPPPLTFFIFKATNSLLLILQDVHCPYTHNYFHSIYLFTFEIRENLIP